LLNIRVYPKIKPLILVCLISVFIALGKYNPLYVLMLKLTKFYGFRNPSKLLFFTLFSFSVFSGLGFSKFFNKADDKFIKVASKIFIIISSACLSVLLTARIILVGLREKVLPLLDRYVIRHVYGKPFHRYDLDVYKEKVRGMYQSLVDGAAFSDLFILFSICMLIAGIGLCVYLHKKPEKRYLLRTPIFCLIFLDIYVYSFYGTGFRGNVKDFEYLQPTHQKVLGVLQSDHELFRILPLGIKTGKLPFWAVPNANILAGIDSVAAYTPLVEASYKQSLLPLEVVDDSLGLLSPADNALAEKYQLLRLLNVKYIISSSILRQRFLKKIATEKEVFLYEVKDYLPRIFFTRRIDGRISKEPTEDFKILEYRDGFARIDIETDKDGFLVFSENYYPGWRAEIGGEITEIVLIKDLVQAVKLPKGRHRVTLKFR